jgi:tetratricopeptide (TPR) repeat protein
MKPVIVIQSNRSQHCATNKFRCQLGRLTCLVSLTLLLSLPAQAQTTAATQLTPEAEAAMKKGIVAAKEQEWLIAIQSFQEARKIAPESPAVFYNLGLAESKIPGRELRAIAWFGAYLTAIPNAPNAAAVNDFIAALQIKNHGNINRLIKTAQDAASQTGNQSCLDAVARLWLEAGDLPAALKTVDLNHVETNSDIIASNKSLALSKIAKAQAKAGDMAGARKTFASALECAELIQSAYIKGSSQLAIISYQADAGDIAGALQTVALANYSGFSDKVGAKSKSLSGIAQAQVESGNTAGVRESLSQALNLANSIHDANDRCDALREVAKVQAKLGDIRGAGETLAGVLKAWSSIEDRQLKTSEASVIGQLYFDIAKAQLKAGDFSGARESLVKYAASHPDPENEYMTKWLISSFQKEIDDAQAKAGSANKSASAVSPTIVAQAPIPVIKVADWIYKLDDNVDQPASYSVCPLNTEPFLDLTGYLTTHPMIPTNSSML